MPKDRNKQTNFIEGVLRHQTHALKVLPPLVAAFALTAALVTTGLTQTFDVQTLLAIDATLPESLYGVMIFFTTIGYYRVCAVAAFVAAGVFFWLGWRTSAAALLVSTLGGMTVTTALKYTFGRDRPDFIDSGYTAGSFAFPSGHATMGVGFYGVLAAILFLHLRGPARWFAAFFGAVVGLLIGLSRMYLGVHYPSDILAGYLISPIILTLAVAISSLLTKRKPAGQTP